MNPTACESNQILLTVQRQTKAYSSEEDLAQLEMYINQCVFNIVNTRVIVLSADKDKQTIKISLKLGNKEYIKEVNVYGRL